MGKHLIHKKSNSLDGVEAKLPIASDIEYGELAINYLKDNETITLKNSNNEIVTFKSEKNNDIKYVNVSGDTMTGQLNIESNLNVGSGNTVTGLYAMAQGEACTASGKWSHAEGWSTTANALGSHAEGSSTIASRFNSHAEGGGTIASGQASHAEGSSTIASGEFSHAEGGTTIASGIASHAEGSSTIAIGDSSHAEGGWSIANNYAEHASGSHNVSISGISQDTSDLTKDSQATLFSIGNGASEATRKNAVEVKWNGDTYISGNTSISKTLNVGSGNTVTGEYAFAQGENCTASGEDSHAEGIATIASGPYSHAEGDGTQAMGNTSHAEGEETIARGKYSHAEGGWSIANNRAEHASGSYNVSISGTNQNVTALTNDGQATLFSIGNGSNNSTRKNALEVKWNGDTYISGDAKVSKGLTAATISATTLNAPTINTTTLTANSITTNVFTANTISANTITATTLSGNATSATKLQTARTIALAGDVTGSVSFDGTANVTITNLITPTYAGSATKGGAATSANKVNSTLTLSEGTFTSKSFDGSAAVSVNVPTKTSHVTNDSDFATNAGVSAANVYLTSVLGSANGAMTFNRRNDAALTFDSTHIHPISEITGLQGELDSKVNNTTYNTYTAATDASITNVTNLANTKVAQTEYNTYTANTNTAITNVTNLANTKVSQTDYNTYTADTNTTITNINNSANSKIGSIQLVHDAADSLHYTLMVDSVNKGEINIPKDQFLKSASYDEAAKELVFVFTTTTGEVTNRVNVSNLVDTYTAGNGLSLASNIFSIDTSVVATNTALNNGLATKQDTGDYATNTALNNGLATKQATGDYATNTALNNGLAGKSDTNHTHSIYVLKAGDTMSGNLIVQGTISATTQIYSSDITLKENIELISDEDINVVRSINSKAYMFKEDSEHRVRYGTIAQELEETKLSELVYSDENGIKGVDYISYLVLKCEQLQRDLNALQSKFDTLK